MADVHLRKLYDDIFRQRVVDYHVEHEGSLASTAEKFGVTAGMLHKWLKKFPGNVAKKVDGGAPGDQEIRELRQEIRAMKGEIAELKRIISKAFLTRFMEE